jgi:AraC-like DNA-binding protein
MLTAFLSGRGFYVLERRRTVIEDGVIGLVAGADPGILLADPAAPYDHYYCRFSGDYARLLAGEILERRGNRFFADDRCERIADLLRRMGQTGRALLPSRMGRQELLLAEALELLAGPAGASSANRLTANSLRSYLLEHVSEPFELSPAAAHFGMSRAALCRAARRVAGRTVGDIAEELKIDWARTLLASGGLNVAETARRVGYSDPFYFSRVFRKRTGLSPRAWLKARAGRE